MFEAVVNVIVPLEFVAAGLPPRVKSDALNPAEYDVSIARNRAEELYEDVHAPLVAETRK